MVASKPHGSPSEEVDDAAAVLVSAVVAESAGPVCAVDAEFAGSVAVALEVDAPGVVEVD